MVDLDVLLAILLNGLRLCQACRADFGMREDDGGDVVIGEFGGFELRRSEEAVSELTASSDGD